METMQAIDHTAKIIDGRQIAQHCQDKAKAALQTLQTEHSLTPCLGVILVEGDPASEIYVSHKKKKAESLGIKSLITTLPADSTADDIANQIDAWNEDDSVHGILLQLPLPPHIDSYALLQMISPEKDVDGLHTINAGRLSWKANDGIVPCTPMGCLTLLESEIKDFTGLHAVMVGSSNLVGRPMAQLLLQKNCTISVAHSKTKDLKALTSQADILVVATGNPNLIRGDMVKPGAVVIDVGINRVNDGSSKIVGDVNFEEVSEIAGAITPVPGGVGPMTITYLMINTINTAARQSGVQPPLV